MDRDMKIELRKITYNARLSEETPAFAADVYIDGKKRGDVRNDGHGGCHRIEPRALDVELGAYAKTLPPMKSPWGGEPLPMDADMVLSDLLFEYLNTRDLTRKMKAKTMFLRGGVLYEIKKPGVPKNADVILNDLPFEKALAEYRKVVNGETGAGR
jgi:hypothetical protein